MARRLQVPGAFDMIPLADGLVRVIGVICGEDCPIVNTPLRQLTGLFPDLHIEILAIVRGGRPIVADSDDQMLPGDEVYFVTDTNHVARAMAAFGHEEREARRIIIIGGGNIGLTLATEIERDIIPASPPASSSAAASAPAPSPSRLNRTTVLHGDALDSEILDEANVRSVGDRGRRHQR